MKTLFSFATYPARKRECMLMLQSIEGQFDEVHCYYNNVATRPTWMPEWVNVVCGGDNDLTDIGKFFALKPDLDCIFFTGDDDMIYPKDYAKEITKWLGLYGCIVTLHGRVLKPNVKDYYMSHETFRVSRDETETKELDVAGTGVTAFNTKYFNPYWIVHTTQRRMSDLTFSLEAAKHDKVIIGLPHKGKWIKDTQPKQTIYNTMFHNQSELIKTAKQIYEQKNNRTERVG
jgi:hypothetical protein